MVNIMKKQFSLFFSGAVLALGFLLSGCDKSTTDMTKIKVGVINGAEQ